MDSQVTMSEYDKAMLFGALALACRYGDSQTYDWAKDFRERIVPKPQTAAKADETGDQ